MSSSKAFNNSRRSALGGLQVRQPVQCVVGVACGGAVRVGEGLQVAIPTLPHRGYPRSGDRYPAMRYTCGIAANVWKQYMCVVMLWNQQVASCKRAMAVTLTGADGRSEYRLALIHRRVEKIPLRLALNSPRMDRAAIPHLRTALRCGRQARSSKELWSAMQQ